MHIEKTVPLNGSITTEILLLMYYIVKIKFLINTCFSCVQT